MAPLRHVRSPVMQSPWNVFCFSRPDAILPPASMAVKGSSHSQELNLSIPTPPLLFLSGARQCSTDNDLKTANPPAMARLLHARAGAWLLLFYWSRSRPVLD